jgi:hypothetical protein
VLNSPTDIFVTLYEDGYPKYVSYDNVALPTTINLDASTEAVAADRTFTMTLPTNNLFSVAIEAFENDESFSRSMCRYFSFSGGPSVNVGYKQGYQKYRTGISIQDGRKSFSLAKTGPTVEETHTFPSFDFDFGNPNLNNFDAYSHLPYDVAHIDFQHNQPGLVLLWNVIQPPSAIPQVMAFKAKTFPQEILDKYPTLPSPEQVQFSVAYGYQLTGGESYASIIDTASKSGSVLINLFFDNYIRFGKTRL